MYRVTIDFKESGEKTFTEKDENGVIDVTWRRVINMNYTPENHTATVRMKNVDRYWYDILKSSDKALTGQKMKILYDETCIGTLIICDFTPGDTFEIQADSFSELENTISPKLTKDVFEQIPEENEGKHGNICGGTLSDQNWLDAGMCTAYRIDSNIYHAAWNDLHDITQVFDENRQSLNFTFEYSASLECTIINCTEAANALEIFFNCTGFKDEFQNLITNPARILEQIALDFGGPTLTGINDAANIFQEKQYLDNAILITNENWKSFFRMLGINYDTHFFPTPTGEWKIKAHDYSDPQPAICLKTGDVENYNSNFNPKTVINEAVRRFFYHYRENKFKYQPPETISTAWQSSEIELDLKYHTGNLPSYDITTELLFLRKQPDEDISLDMLIENLTFDLGDCIEVIADDGFRKEEKRTYLVSKINDAGSGKVKIGAIDIFTLNTGRIILLEESDPEVAILTDETHPDCLILI